MSMRALVNVRIAVLRATLEGASVGWPVSTYDAIKVARFGRL